MTGFEAWHWEGVMVPEGTPAEIVQKLAGRLRRRAPRSPRCARSCMELGVDPVGNSTAEFTAFLAADRDRFAKMFAYTGLQPE